MVLPCKSINKLSEELLTIKQFSICAFFFVAIIEFLQESPPATLVFVLLRIMLNAKS